MNQKADLQKSLIVLHWRAFLLRSFVALGGLWTATELYVGLIDPNVSANSRGLILLFAVMFFSLLIGGGLVWQSVRSVSFKLRGVETNLTISFGDVFSDDIDLVVPVNSMFDHSLQTGTAAMPVSPRSVHGQLVNILTKKEFRTAVDSSLDQSNVSYTEVVRPIQPSRKYELGTVATVASEGRHFYLIAITNTDDNDKYRVKTSLPEAFPALAKAWSGIAATANNRPLRMPLIGGGFANLKIDNEHILDILIASIVEFSLRERRITTDIEIMLPSHLRGRIRCYNIKAEWS